MKSFVWKNMRWIITGTGELDDKVTGLDCGADDYLTKSRRKIVLAILSVLVLLVFGTLCTIYLASYVEMTRENRALLEQYVDSYTLVENMGRIETGGGKPVGGSAPRPMNPPMLELSTFYSVALSDSGQVLKVDTADVSSIDEESLVELAAESMERGETDGVEHNLIYRMEDKGGYVLVQAARTPAVQREAATGGSAAVRAGTAVVPAEMEAACLLPRTEAL